jgi:hypothetical protein
MFKIELQIDLSIPPPILFISVSEIFISILAQAETQNDTLGFFFSHHTQSQQIHLDLPLKYLHPLLSEASTQATTASCMDHRVIFCIT